MIRNVDGTFTFSSSALEVNKPTVNGRIYSKEALNEAIKVYKEKVDAGVAFGQLGSSINDNSNLFIGKVSHVCEDIKMVDNDVICSIRTLNTPEGERINALLEEDFKVKTFTVGIGKLKDDKVEDFELKYIGLEIEQAEGAKNDEK